MPDMLVPLLSLPDLEPFLARTRDGGITVRRANPWEQSRVREFVQTHFTVNWADECSVGFSRQPVSVFVAWEGDRIVGFAAYECARRNVFGPTGVDEAYRGRGIGAALLMASLWSMRAMGYVYAVIGEVGPAAFYQRTCGAVVIPGEHPSYVRHDRGIVR